MKVFSAILFLLLAVTSCRTVNSTTTISPNNSFQLGNNEHGPFKVNLKNLSKDDVEVYQMPIGQKSVAAQMVAPNKSVSVSVPANTALVIVNNTRDTANVKLKLKGDTGLSMKYKG